MIESHSVRGQDDPFVSSHIQRECWTVAGTDPAGPKSVRRNWWRFLEMADLQVILEPGDDLLARFTAMVERLGSSKLRSAERRALNHVGGKAFTAVKRALVNQTSLPRAAIQAGVTTVRASVANSEEFRIVGKGNRLPLRLFGPVQFSYGVRVKVWGVFRQYRHTFIIDQYARNVFKRVGPSRLPIKKLWGPGVASELVRDESAEAFEAVATELGPRLMHEIEFISRV